MTYTGKVEKLAPVAQELLLCDYGRRIEREIAKTYASPAVTKFFVGDIVSGLYFGDISFSSLLSNLSTSGLDETRNKSLARDIVGKRILIARNYFKQAFGVDVDAELMSLGGSSSDYRDVLLAYPDELRKERSDGENAESAESKRPEEKLEFNDPKYEPKQEMADSIEVFSSALLPMLEYNDLSLLSEYNLVLLHLLDEKNDFKYQLEKALYQNDEIISEKPFVLNGKAEKSCVKNWLLDFIETQGSGLFNNIQLTRYLANSENAKKLDSQEKRVLGRLLAAYRNVKFFPEAMDGMPIEQWEIIPTEKATEPGREKQLPQNKPAGREALIQELKGNIDNYAPGSLEREILEEEDEKDREYHKLILLKNKYPEGSLERRAVEEELRKMGR